MGDLFFKCEALSLQASFTPSLVTIPEDEEQDFDEFRKIPADSKNGNDLPKSANEYNTFMPRKAGNLTLRKFIMALSIVMTIPGLVTSSFNVGIVNFAAPVSAPAFSAAAASISGVIDLVNFEGSCSINFCNHEGRCLYDLWS